MFSEVKSRREHITLYVIFSVLLIIGAYLRLHLAFTDDGIYYPDEIYQSLEPAHWLVYGYGLLSHEFVEGSRHWFFPSVVAWIMQYAKLIGLDEPATYLWFIKSAFVALSLLSSVTLMCICRNFGGSNMSCLVALGISLLSVPFIYFAPRALSENAATLPLLISLAMITDVKASTKKYLIGLCFMGIACLFRLHMLLVFILLIIHLLCQKDYRPLKWAIGVLVIFIVLHGFIDKLSWGNWFQSTIQYTQRHMTQDIAKMYGRSNISYYIVNIFSSMVAIAWLLIGLSCWVARKTKLLLILLLGFIAAHSLFSHRELRFILPVLPLLCVTAALGLQELNQRYMKGKQHVYGYIIIAIAIIISLVKMPKLSFADIGQNMIDAQVSAYDFTGSVNRLLLIAHTKEDLCGIKVANYHRSITGGHTYLHRRVPLYGFGDPGKRFGYFNYMIARGKVDKQELIIAKDADFKLIKLPIEKCVADRTYVWRAN